MQKDKYKKLVLKLSPKENKQKNAIIAFFIGGLVGVIGEIIIYMLMHCFGLSRADSYAYLAMIMILFGSLFSIESIFSSSSVIIPINFTLLWSVSK